jgi:hypothetical protein
LGLAPTPFENALPHAIKGEIREVEQLAHREHLAQVPGIDLLTSANWLVDQKVVLLVPGLLELGLDLDLNDQMAQARGLSPTSTVSGLRVGKFALFGIVSC